MGIDGRRCSFSPPDLGDVRFDIIGVELEIGRVAPVIGLVKSLQGYWSCNVKVTIFTCIHTETSFMCRS